MVSSARGVTCQTYAHSLKNTLQCIKLRKWEDWIQENAHAQPLYFQRVKKRTSEHEGYRGKQSIVIFPNVQHITVQPNERSKTDQRNP